MASTRRVNKKIADSTRNQQVFFQGILQPTTGVFIAAAERGLLTRYIDVAISIEIDIDK